MRCQYSRYVDFWGAIDYRDNPGRHYLQASGNLIVEFRLEAKAIKIYKQHNNSDWNNGKKRKSNVSLENMIF